MKVTTLGSFLVAVVMAGIALSMPAAVDAQSPPVAPNTCTITIGANTIDVTTVPAGMGFPAQVDCPPFVAAGGLTGQCLEWSYLYTNRNEGSISLAGVTVSSDISVVVPTAGNPESTASASISAAGAGDTSLGLARNVFDVRAVRFSAPGPTISGNVYTPVNVGTGQVTAAAKIGNVSGFCGIAGPANLVTPGPGKVAITTTIISQAGKCTVARTVDAAGCTVAVDFSTTTFPNNPPDCASSTEDVALISDIGTMQSGLNCNSQITFGSNSKYCFTSSVGRLTCIISP